MKVKKLGIFLFAGMSICRVANAELILCNNAWLDTEGYVNYYPDLKAAGVNACDHYTNSGSTDAEKRNPNPFGLVPANPLMNCAGDKLDPVGYVNYYPDLKAARVNPCDHYSSNGKSENRNPNPYNISSSGTTSGSGQSSSSSSPSTPISSGQLVQCNGVWIDPIGYVNSYPDLLAAGVNACEHYTNNGRSENRNPNPFNYAIPIDSANGSSSATAANTSGKLVLCNGIWIDPVGYVSSYPDLLAAGVNACEHYTNNGKSENRNPNPFNYSIPTDSSSTASSGNVVAPTVPSTSTPSSNSQLITCNGDLLDTIGYVNYYPDLKAAGVNACEHYKNNGKSENRNPNPYGLTLASNGQSSSGSNSSSNTSSGTSTTTPTTPNTNGPAPVLVYADSSTVTDSGFEYESAAVYSSGQYSPWAKFGKFTNHNLDYGSHFDFIGGARNLKYKFSDFTDRFTNLGIARSGIVTTPLSINIEGEAGFNADFYQREPDRLRRYKYECQKGCYERTKVDMHEFFVDVNPVGYGQTFTLDSGEQWTPSNGDNRGWNIVFAYYNKADNALGHGMFGSFRYNAEGHPGIGDMNYYVKGRYIWNGGKYRPERAGGQDFTEDDGDPAYAKMSDWDWYLHVVWAQISYDEWINSGIQAATPGSKFFKYDMITAGVEVDRASPGSAWNDVHGFQKNFYWTDVKTKSGKSWRDILAASTYGFYDLLFHSAPFVITKAGVLGHNNVPAPAHLAIAEFSTPKDEVVNTPAEFFRYSVRQQGCGNGGSEITIRFEDKDGRLAPSRERYFTESSTGGNWVTHYQKEIPQGSTKFTYCYENRLSDDWVNMTLDDRVDDSLVTYFKRYQFHYVLDDGKPATHQNYAYSIGPRFPNSPNESQPASNLPRNLVVGIRFLGVTYKFGHFWYSMGGVGTGEDPAGYMTMDNIFYAEKRINKYVNHFNGQEKALDVQISIDDGATWTSEKPISPRADIDPNFYVMNNGAYHGEWISKRAKNGQGSPLVLVTYNPGTGTYVVFDKALYTNSISYMARVRGLDGNWKALPRRTVTRTWSDTSFN